MSLGNFARYVEPEADASVAVPRVWRMGCATRQGLENVTSFLRGNRRPLVMDFDPHARGRTYRPQENRTVRGAVLDGILQQIGKHLGDPIPVPTSGEFALAIDL